MDTPHLSGHPVPAPAGSADQGGYGPVSRAVTPAEVMLEAALWYTRQGQPVFPCVPGGKQPASSPTFRHGWKSAVTYEDVIRATWREKPYNVATPTGAATYDVLDIDVRPGGSGWAALSRLRDAGLLAGAFRIVRTPSGGLHVYFAGTTQRCGSLKGLFVDFKSAGGFILVPPSRVGGRPYEVVDDRPLTGVTFNWQAAKQLLCPPRPLPMRAGSYRHGPGSARHLVSWLEGEIEGNRNSGLFWACCRALEAGDEEVVSELTDVALSAGLPEAEVNRTIGSAYRKVSGDDR